MIKLITSKEVSIAVLLSFTILYAQNNALNFDGINDYVIVTDDNSLDNNSYITISMWIYPETIINKDCLISKRSVTEQSGNYALRFNSSNQLKWYIWGGNSDNGSTTSTSSIVTNAWTHIAITFDNSNNTTKFYINGSLDNTSTTISKNLAANSSDMHIGWDGQNSRYYNGKIDDMSIWSDIRTQSEIQSAMYTELSGTESNLIAYYKFNETSGTTASDETSNDNDGTLTNMGGSTEWVNSFSMGVMISGDSGFRMMSSPVSGQIYSDLLEELWIQGMIGGDVTDGAANVWTLNVANQSWDAISNINTESLTSGTGFLIYIYDDIDWDGNSDLPTTLSVSGTENSSSASINNISSGNYALAGNPYGSTIDWDLVSKTNLSGTTSIWDDASSSWKSWNGSSGSLSDGLIAPYQGFWVQATGGTGSLIIETSDKATSPGSFYRTLNDERTGSISFTISKNDAIDQTFLSFTTSGQIGLDNADGEKLLPFQPSNRVVVLTYVENSSLDIHNLPSDYTGSISLPLDVMSLTINQSNYITNDEEINLSWDLEQIPDHIDLLLLDNLTGLETVLHSNNWVTINTEQKGSFSLTSDAFLGSYPKVGESRFTLRVIYNVLDGVPEKVVPVDLKLDSVHPNPFNPNTIICFDAPDKYRIRLSVYDISGALKETLFDGKVKSGSHKYNWRPEGLSTGIYLLKLSSKDKTLIRKVTYVK